MTDQLRHLILPLIAAPMLVAGCSSGPAKPATDGLAPVPKPMGPAAEFPVPEHWTPWPEPTIDWERFYEDGDPQPPGTGGPGDDDDPDDPGPGDPGGDDGSGDGDGDGDELTEITPAECYEGMESSEGSVAGAFCGCGCSDTNGDGVADVCWSMTYQWRMKEPGSRITQPCPNADGTGCVLVCAIDRG